MKLAVSLVVFLLFLFCFSSATPSFAANTGDVVINEAYYDVDSAHGSETSNEWIELYNKSASTIDISKWTITDNFSTKIVPEGTTLIPTGGILLISPDSATWNYWTIDASVIKVIMPLGNGLSNTGDKLLLKDESGIEIDATSYGANIEVWNPSIEDVAEGHSLERIPGGTDSNSISDFTDQESPTPGRLIAQAPTNTPTPTSTPTLTPTPTPTPAPTPTPTRTPTSTPTPAPTKTPTPSPTPTIVLPTEVLGESTESAIPTEAQLEIKATESSKQKQKVLGEQTNNAPKILIGIGVIFLIACGILIFRKFKMKNAK